MSLQACVKFRQVCLQLCRQDGLQQSQKGVRQKAVLRCGKVRLQKDGTVRLHYTSRCGMAYLLMDGSEILHYRSRCG